jgi:hypothetical protein
VFSQALRNVLTASASHRPLMDAVEDNHLALARFDQLQRAFTATVLLPLHEEMEKYHRTCREGTERLNAREQDTYDPCLLYLNQLRRRMDLQRYADMLHAQQDHIINRLRVLTSGLTDLSARNLVQAEHAADHMKLTHCPFDGTPISIEDASHDLRVKCQRCGYAFLATPGVPQISVLKREPLPLAEDGGDPDGARVRTGNRDAEANDEAKLQKADAKVGLDGRGKGSNPAAIVLTLGIILLPLSWLPMLGYMVLTALQGLAAPLTPLLGKAGLVGSVTGLVVVLAGVVGLVRRWLKRKS